MSRTPSTARRLFDRFEPIHALTYFAAEAREALGQASFRGFWRGYFAARSAPLGPVTADVVTAIFYNFSPSHVARALPSAWEQAGPADALRVREGSAVAALRRYGVTGGDAVRTAAELLAKAASHAPVGGRPLFAANHALPWPEEPVAKLWHAATLLREQRGDGHVSPPRRHHHHRPRPPPPDHRRRRHPTELDLAGPTPNHTPPCPGPTGERADWWWFRAGPRTASRQARCDGGRVLLS